MLSYPLKMLASGGSRRKHSSRPKVAPFSIRLEAGLLSLTDHALKRHDRPGLALFS
jgi:hypothetical protein